MYWKKHSIYRVWFHPDFQAFTDVLELIPQGDKGSILQGSWGPGGAEHRLPSTGKGTWKDFCRRVGWTITPGQEKPEHTVTYNQGKKPSSGYKV